MDSSTTSHQVASKKKLSTFMYMILFRLMAKCCKFTDRVIRKSVFNHQSSQVSCLAGKEYEFSCSTTPAHRIKGKQRENRARYPSSMHEKDVTTKITALKIMFEMLNAETAEASAALPGFVCSPLVQQLQTRDGSPFWLNGVIEEDSVDKKADEFIGRFYTQLRLQIKMMDNESWN